MDALPSLNQQIALVGDDGEYASRVEGVNPDSLTVARPFDVPAESTLQVGAMAELTWTTPQAVFRCPVQILESKREGAVALWDVRPTGTITKIQRRAHVRVAVGAPMTIQPEEGDAVRALLVDVSEAALRCHIEVPATPPPAKGEADVAQPESLTVARPTTVSFSLAGTDFSLSAAVYRNDRIDATSRELVLTFVIDDNQATDVRKAIFAEQIRLRQLMGR